eukprot:jgi/Botrbrau1/3835/Bobra.0183s0060.1
MATCFWNSTHAKALVTRERLLEAHAKDRERGLTPHQIQQLKNFAITYMGDLAKWCQNMVRQRVVATAVTYLRQFYLRACLVEVDPRLLAPACLYLAAKAEEAQLQAKVLLHFIKKMHAPNTGRYQHVPAVDVKHLLDLEMVLLEGLNFDLVVFSPYHDLERMLLDAGLVDIAPTAWSVCNDSYRTDLCVLYPPYIIALACVVVAAAIEYRDIEQWLAGLDVTLKLVQEAATELMNMYEQCRDNLSAESCNRLMDLLK